jgi:hypothetical protein
MAQVDGPRKGKLKLAEVERAERANPPDMQK